MPVASGFESKETDSAHEYTFELVRCIMFYAVGGCLLVTSSVDRVGVNRSGYFNLGLPHSVSQSTTVSLELSENINLIMHI